MMAIWWSGVVALLLYMFEAERRDPGPKHGFYLAYIGFLLIVTLPVVLSTMRMVLGGIVARGAALWIENGRLFSAEKRLDVSLADVASVDMISSFVRGRYGVPIYTESIFFRLANGKDVKVWAEFVENEGEVVADLQQRLGLKVTGDMRSWH